MANILYILSGGIACYKSAHTIRLLKKQGHTVQPIMTASATQFITPLTITALSGAITRTDLFDMETESSMDHIQLSRACDIILVAPATANFLAKMAHGLCDDLASTVISASNKPIVVAPSMNPHMWDSPANQDNIAILQNRGVQFIAPEQGDMACGETGTGRMSEPETIVQYMQDILHSQTKGFPMQGQKPLAGKVFLMTVGGTVEPIDTVRMLTNASSGLQGAFIAQQLLEQGAYVHIVCGKVDIEMPHGANIYTVKTAQQMYDKVHDILQQYTFDGGVFASAVSDYRIKTPLTKKHKKSEGLLVLELVENPDILQSVCVSKYRPKYVVGFSAETDNVIAYATKKLHSKGCDMIFANVVHQDTFGGDCSHAYLIRHQDILDLGHDTKYTHATHLVQNILEYM